MVRKTPHNYVLHSYSEVTLENVSYLPREGSISLGVVFENESLRDRNARQLDPKVCTLANMIKNKQIIKPSDVGHLFDIQDVTELNDLREIENEKVLKFIEQHQDQIKKPEVESE